MHDWRFENYIIGEQLVEQRKVALAGYAFPTFDRERYSLHIHTPYDQRLQRGEGPVTQSADPAVSNLMCTSACAISRRSDSLRLSTHGYRSGLGDRGSRQAPQRITPAFHALVAFALAVRRGTSLFSGRHSGDPRGGHHGFWTRCFALVAWRAAADRSAAGIVLAPLRLPYEKRRGSGAFLLGAICNV